MKGKLKSVIAVSFIALLVSGCATYSAGVVSNQGKAYVIRTKGWTQQDMLHGDASSGRPVCTTQAEN